MSSLFCDMDGALSTSCHAQRPTAEWQHFYQMIADEEEDDEEQMELIFDAINEAAATPININAISREQLQQLLCFSEDQIDAILDYVDRYAPLRTKAELLMIPYLDTARRGILDALTYLGEAPEKHKNELDSLKYDNAVREYRHTLDRQSQKGEVVGFMRIPLYSRRGPYLGGPLKHWLRASYSFNRRMKAGVVASQDAGEPFFAGKNAKGYDFYSAYVQLQKYGLLKKLVAGRYRIKSGLGLVLNNNFSFGKTFSLASIQSTNASLRPHYSRSEGNYMQGAAAVLTLSKTVEATIFASYRRIDATLTADSTGIATILKSGYHRTASEMRRRHNAGQATTGANIRVDIGQFHIGATAVANHYDRPLMPYNGRNGSLTYLYKRFYASGTDFWNAGINYGYRLGKRLRLEGETATGDCREVATINTMSWRPSREINIMLIQRYYPYKFYSTVGRSFSEGGSNQNESGVYIGGTWSPSSRLSMTVYSDIAYFAWPKYQALGSSHAFDNLFQVAFQTSSHSSLTARYRMRFRQKDSDTAGKLIYKNEHRLRVAYNSTTGRWSWKAQTDIANCSYKTSTWGAMLSGNATYSLGALDFSCGGGYFNTDGYDARVYAYEQSTPYSLSFPTFYGNGMRLYALAQADLTKGLTAVAKCGLTHYFDRDEIGSYTQRIDSSTQTDIDITIKWNF